MQETMPANTRRLPNVGLMLGRRRRRRANIKPLDYWFMSAGCDIDPAIKQHVIKTQHCFNVGLTRIHDSRMFTEC